MEPKVTKPTFTTGETVGAWLPVKLRAVFRAHVGNEQGAAGKFVTAAVVEKLTREGAFACDAVEDVTATVRELVAVHGPEAVKSKLAELRADSALAAAGGGK